MTHSFIASVTPPGYKCTHVPRPEGRGGGVGFFICDDIDFKVLPQQCFNTFESISVPLSMGNVQDIVFHTVYRPPMFSKPISLRISFPSSKVLLYHVLKI